MGRKKSRVKREDAISRALATTEKSHRWKIVKTTWNKKKNEWKVDLCNYLQPNVIKSVWVEERTGKIVNSKLTIKRKSTKKKKKIECKLPNKSRLEKKNANEKKAVKKAVKKRINSFPISPSKVTKQRTLSERKSSKKTMNI